ncbi:MAG: aminotransferase class I/II-fold pyridoxal phosphate-dependent enzyme [Alphaproteobacteria bacterium]
MEEKIDQHGLKSLFIVSPNNPTGFQLSPDEFRDICQLCRRKDVTLIVDATFRFYSKQTYDSYQTLKDTSVDFIVIEDTGKTWPTQDMKVSLMAYSEPLAKDLRLLYEEFYLCTSNFSLALLSKLIDETHKVGLDKIVWQEVEKRTARVESAIANTPLKLVKNDRDCTLPVAWIDCSKTGMTDVEILEKLRPHNIAVLPGRFFFWNSQQQHTDRIRISLMKPDDVFYKGVDVLERTLPQVFGATNAPSPTTPQGVAANPIVKKNDLG